MKLGNVFSVAIHDPEIMYQCLMKQKTVFAGRAMLQARKALSNNGKGLAFSRYNAGWCVYTLLWRVIVFVADPFVFLFSLPTHRRFKHKLSHAALFNMGKVKSQGDHMSAQVWNPCAALVCVAESHFDRAHCLLPGCQAGQVHARGRCQSCRRWAYTQHIGASSSAEADNHEHYFHAGKASKGHRPTTPLCLTLLPPSSCLQMMSASWHPSDPQFKIMADAVDKVLECLGATVGVDFLPHRRWYTTCILYPPLRHTCSPMCVRMVYSRCRIPSAMKPIAEMKKAQQALLAFIRPIVEEHCKSVDRENVRHCAIANQLESHPAHSQDPPHATCTAP